MSDQLLTLAQFASFIAASTKTADRIVKRGELPSFKLGGRVCVKFSDVEKWLEMNRVERVVTTGPGDLKSLVARAVERARGRRSA